MPKEIGDLDLLASLEKQLIGHRKMGIEEFGEACKKTLFPLQLLLLKIIFLEELTQKEEDSLDHWIAGGRGGSEILISPLIRERMEWLKQSGYEHFREVVLVGGRRSGKGHITGVAGAYMMYNLIDVDVMKEFNIDPDKSIYFSCIAASQDQAKAHQYADFASTVSSCPMMQDYIFKIRELEFSVLTEYDKRRTKDLESKMGRVVGRDMSKLRGSALAANAKTVRGSATLFAALDEVAHMQQEGASYMTATAVYDALSPSLLQFGRHSLCMLNSSPYTKIGKFYEKYLEALKVDENKPGNPAIFCLQFPSWATYAPDPAVRKSFRRPVELASPDWDEDELDDYGDPLYTASDIDKIRIAKVEEQSDPEKFKVENRAQWAEVLDAFLAPEMVDRAFLGRPRGDNQYEPFKVNWSSPQPNVDYICHLDPSSTTAGFGFVMGHTEQFPEKDPKTGEIEYIDHFCGDIIKRWIPSHFTTENHGVDMVFDYEWVLEEITHWVKIFRPTEITVDQFGASAIIAWLNKWCRENDMQSTRVYEKTASVRSNYVTSMRTRDALYLDRVHLPSDTADCDWLALEMKNLQITHTQGGYSRIDCPTVGMVKTKDIYSALSSVVFSLIGDTAPRLTAQMLGEVKPSLGAQGGYIIGGTQLQRRSLASLRPDVMGDNAHSYTRGSLGGAPGANGVNYGNWARKGNRSR